MLTTGTVVTSATALRLTRAWVELWADRTPPLARHAVNATVRGDDMPTAQATFRDEMIALARASAEVSWRELRKGVDQYDALTRAGESRETPAHRPHRVKP